MLQKLLSICFIFVAACSYSPPKTPNQIPDAVPEPLPGVGAPSGPPPSSGPPVVVAPDPNYAPLYFGGANYAGPVQFVTSSNSSIATQYILTITGAGAGGGRYIGGGGAGGTVILGLTNIPANTAINLGIGKAGFGSQSQLGPGYATNGGDTVISVGSTWITTATGGAPAGGSAGYIGGAGGAGFADSNSPYIITGSLHIMAGGDGEDWNGVEGVGGSSYWGGNNLGLSGGAEGAGGSSTDVTGFSAGNGVVQIQRVYQ